MVRRFHRDYYRYCTLYIIIPCLFQAVFHTQVEMMDIRNTATRNGWRTNTEPGFWIALKYVNGELLFFLFHYTHNHRTDHFSMFIESGNNVNLLSGQNVQSHTHTQRYRPKEKSHSVHTVSVKLMPALYSLSINKISPCASHGPGGNRKTVCDSLENPPQTARTFTLHCKTAELNWKNWRVQQQIINDVSLVCGASRRLTFASDLRTGDTRTMQSNEDSHN